MSSLYIRAILFLCLFTALAFGQADRGALTGTVQDTSGAVVPEAQITATATATGVQYRSTTTQTGDFTIPSLPVGTYSVAIEKEGFKQTVHKDVVLSAGSTIRLDTRLDLGTAQAMVEVTAAAPMLSTDSAKVGSQVANKMVDELPLVVGGGLRNPFNLATITPGVNGSGGGFRMGGGQSGAFGITLDGVSANTNRFGDTNWAAINTPSVEAITEFAVETNGFKAEFGRAGGGVITFVSKSGTNEFHGTAYEFLRNDALDARGFFNTSKPVYKQHDFGASVGGPVIIPKLYNGKNRTFFFGNYEGFRNRRGASTAYRSVMPAEFFEGDFRNLVDRKGNRLTIYDPATTRLDPATGKYIRDPFPNNIIPKERFDPLAAKLLPIYAAVKPNRPGITPGSPDYIYENYIASGSEVNPVNKYSIKLDHNLNDSHRLAFYGGYTKSEKVPGPGGAPGLPGPLSNFMNGAQDSAVYRGSWDYVISPRVINRFYFGVNTWKELNAGLTEGQGWADRVCMPNVPDCDRLLTQVALGQYGSWGHYGSNGSENPIYSFNNDITFISGSHTMKGGYLYEFTPYNGFGRQNIAGFSEFNRMTTSVPLENDQLKGGGDPFASFLLGEAWMGSIHTERFVAMGWRYHAMFFQDDWRLTNKLTLNLGLRYEFNLPPLERDDHWSDFDPTRPNPGAGNLPGALVFAGFGEGREGKRTLAPGWYGGIGPRIGFSYSADSKTVVRGGFARSFAPVKTVGGTAHWAGFALIRDWPNTTNGLERTFKFSEGIPEWTPPPFINPAFSNGGDVDWWQGQEANRLPENLSYTLHIQRQLSGSTMVEIGYDAMTGSHLIANLLRYNQVDASKLPAELSPFTESGRNLLYSRDFNHPTLVRLGIKKPYEGFNGTVERALRPFPQYNNINTRNAGGDHSGHSTYHSMVARIQRRYSNGFTLDASYVLSKMLTDAESYEALEGGIDHYNRGLEKSLASFDRTHEFKINYVWEIPFGRGRQFLNDGWLSHVVGGWRIGAVHYYASGTPIGLGGAFSFPIYGNRPYVTTYEGWRGATRGDEFDPYVDNFFQPKSFFPEQPKDRLGNATRRNPKLRNFPAYNENVSLAKSFALGEGKRIDFRWEAFNLFNRVQFGGPDTNLSGVNFGLVRSQANSPRQMQGGLKFYW